jgi:superfamily II DNA or RNA helicase
MPYQDLPDLSAGVLAEMGGWPVLREARALVERGAVKSVEWEKPYVRAFVEAGGAKFTVKLSLRSTAFVENSCNCEKGRKGFVCAHAVAACIAIARLKAEAEKEAANPKLREKRELEEKARKLADARHGLSTLKFLNVDASGRPLECRFVLPPNLSDSAPRNMIVVKLEFLFEGKRIPPEKIFRGASYKMDEATIRALCMIEKIGGGMISSILQLKRAQLRELIGIFDGMPVFEWQGKDCVRWEAGKLTGVSEYLEEPVGTAAFASPSAGAKTPVISVRRSSGVMTSRTIGETLLKMPPMRRVALRVEKNENESGRMIVDGSPHFVSVQIPLHDYPLHERAHALFEECGFRLEPSNARWWLRDRHKVLNFLAEKGEELDRVFAPEYTDNYKLRMQAVHRAKIVAKAESGAGGFTLDMRVEAGESGDEEIRRAMASNQYYIISGDDIWLLPPAMLERLAGAESSLSGVQGQPLVPSIKRVVSAAQVADAQGILDAIADEIETPSQWKSRIEALKNISKLQAPPVPKDLDEKLRGYQRIGAAWMWHLYRNDLGGVLADEMGLGKTVQAVALLTAIKAMQRGSSPALVVCPAGLIENWMREIARFASELRVIRHHGASRMDNVSQLSSCDVAVTSYQTLVRDTDLFLSTEFSVIIADEAQHIKNRRTQAAAALRSLQAKSRFVLTGTPIENSLDDLRSIFAFILPGYLPRIPEGARGDERAWYDERHLKQAVPYILRRSKKLVAPELPEKVEQTVFCELAPEQTRLYNEFLESGRKAIFEMEMSNASEGKLRFEAFTRLLRLRQICVDPRILRPAMEAADSAKLRALEEILNEAIDGGHRVLVFSQFVEALKLVAEMLREKEIAFAYIDGSTPNRQAECDRFNGDESLPVFLISLKAGGVGLNLTGADTVVHYDPWWNPAVEDQATDRAHRIGQTRTVTSIKLIAAGTVEEKVLELQKKKAAILEELLDESAAATGKISMEDIRDLMG